MDYKFSEEAFRTNFNWKSTEEKGADSLRITHNNDFRFKLFPYNANGSTPIVLDTKELIGEFIKVALKIKTPDTDFSSVEQKLRENVEASDEDFAQLSKTVKSIFYKDDDFLADNIGLYAYSGKPQNKSIPRTAKFLNNVFLMDDGEAGIIRNAMDHYHYNVLEKVITECLGSTTSEEETDSANYYVVFEDASNKFKRDFNYMLENGMSSPEDLSNLLALYYFYYTSQTSIVLDQFGQGDREKKTELYFALDWEKVSANRKCCQDGWKSLNETVSHIFSHAITLELLNQIEDASKMLDYKAISDAVRNGELDDTKTADEIRKIEEAYTDAVGDYTKFAEIPQKEGINETDSAMRHLFECVHTQFMQTDRHRANDVYVEKLQDFYRYRWLKNRKKAGLVLNLTESDIIFLTKISIQNQDRMRLTKLFEEYENRGIYLDNNSKALLQEFFTKLNLLDKKSDSGDAQYVKRIL